jgi:dephospho-CoA kinase
MIRIGLTGTIGAGKSEVARLFESWGAYLIDADVLAREAIAPGTPGEEAVFSAFGDRVATTAGAIDRSALREIVFASAEARESLEAIIHPQVDRLRKIQLGEAESVGAAVVVVEVPLLLEKSIQGEFDRIVVVDAPVEIRCQRVTEGRGLTREMFEAIDRTQWAGERKRAMADAVLWNDGDLAALSRAAREVWDGLTAAEACGETWDVDLHMHTSASHDCMSDPARVVEHARKIGLDRIAITDHNEIDGALAARDLDPDLVIVGEEVRTSEGLDLIGLWLTSRIPRGGSFREVAAAIREQGGIVYVPHPFDSHRGTDEDFLDDHAGCIDAVEAFNARIHDQARNDRAATWARRHDLPVGAGSDAHTIGEIGRGRVTLAPFSDPQSFLSSLRDGGIQGRASSRLVHLASTFAKFRK